VLPFLEAVHRRYPKLVISWGIHNTSPDMKTWQALRKLPDYVNLCWEEGVTWAPSLEMARDQMAFRGANEDYAGIYRVTMSCGTIFRGPDFQGESMRMWLPRVEKLWDYIDNGTGQFDRSTGFVVDGKPVGYPCSKDWRPANGGRVIDNPNYEHLLTWARALVNGPAKKKGVFILVEAGLYDLKPRRVPAMAAEAIWNPHDEKTLEGRSRMIWERKVGGWREPRVPYWHDHPAGGPNTAADQTMPIGIPKEQ
jgi:hypothetical protein